jgi:hypothetical protein
VVKYRHIGNFDTHEWRSDPNLPRSNRWSDCGYYVIEADFYDAEATDEPSLKAVLVLNQGDADTNSGFWGCLF